MILYEYECLECAAKFQKFSASKDRLNVICPSCDSKNIKKLWATVSTKNSNHCGGGGCNSCNGCG